uniref:Replicative DNA helicase n=1 Tax=Cyanothece sp. (strain PCC 7425 / ATCC 29141) TaxID=395961 RepID=B8HS23_CYAP4
MHDLNFQVAADRLPPQNVEAEEAILGGILLDPEAIGRVADILRPEAFYLSAHQEIYRAALALNAQGSPTDLMCIAAWLQDQDLLAKVGGQSKLAQLVDRTVSAVNIDQYAQLIKDKYLRRQLIKVATDVSQMAYETTKPLDSILDQAEQKVFSVTQDRVQQGLVSTEDILAQTFNELEQRSLGNVLPGLSCNFYDLDAMTQGFQRSDLVIVAGRPSMGKCLVADSEILLADGRLVTIAQIYQQKQAQLLTLQQNWKFGLTWASDFVDDGIKPVFRVTTRLGRTVTTTLSHPFLTIKGWRPLGELQTGTKIAVPRKLAVFGNETLRECELKILGYLLGDGCLTKTCPEFTNSNPLLQQDFQTAVTEFGQDGLTFWLKKLELWGKGAHTKFIPAVIFQLQRSQIALFLNRLFATDGWATVLASGQSQLGFATVSEKLARQVQHLLLRFGIIATLKHRQVKYQDHRRQAWQLDITDHLSIKSFIDEIGIFGKEAALARVKEALAGRKYQTNTDLIPIEAWERVKTAKGDQTWVSIAEKAGINGTNLHVDRGSFSRERLWKLATALENLSLQQLADSEVYWDEIVAIEPVGEQQVYDLTIPDTHNFVANDICVHNTALSLQIARRIAEIHKLGVAVFSLEMSKEQLVQRLLASESRIDSNYLRAGRISQNQWEPISRAIGSLSQLPIYIDDTPNPTLGEIRSNARRLMAERPEGLGLILLDYLQLMGGGDATDGRVQELSKITRSLKGLARELNVPVIALSQLSRGVESRTNKRPLMSDLRESGCLTGDSLITLADTGKQVPLRQLIGQSGFAVWALNQSTLKLERAIVSHAFATGTKPVFRLQTALGRAIRATGNHKFLTITGWKRLDELQPGERIALPRKIPSPDLQLMDDHELALLGHLIGDGCTLPRHSIQYTTRELDLAEMVSSLATKVFGKSLNPRINPEKKWYQVYLTSNQSLAPGLKNPVTKWLEHLGIFGLRSYEKFIPDQVFEQPPAAIALFLRHLWSTDGCIRPSKKGIVYPAIYYATSSERLARDVQSLLLRLSINGRLLVSSQAGKGRDQYHVWVSGKSDIEKFVQQVGAVGQYKTASLEEVKTRLEASVANTNRDIIPYTVWRSCAVPAMQRLGITGREMQKALGNAYCGTSLYKQNLSRERASRLAAIVNCETIAQLADSDVYWDEVISITQDGSEDVFDLTVPEHHNFVVNNIIVHNSIEQDADLIILLYRDEYYNPDTPDRGICELIIAKHRNGPVGTVKLLFDPQYTRFENLAQGRDR